MLPTNPLKPIRLKGKKLGKLRRRVFERDEYRCRKCGRSVSWESGHMHHVKSRGKGGSDTEANTILLCWQCHAKEHVRVRLGEKVSA